MYLISDTDDAILNVKELFAGRLKSDLLFSEFELKANM